MLRSAENRTYLIIIDNELEGPREALLLKNQPFNAQIGIIGHELAHTAYYLNRSFLGIAGNALCQLTDCRITFERATDRRLIDYGLGWQRFDHAAFVRSRISQDLVICVYCRRRRRSLYEPRRDYAGSWKSMRFTRTKCSHCLRDEFSQSDCHCITDCIQNFLHIIRKSS